jgi:serine/threonine protein kinase
VRNGDQIPANQRPRAQTQPRVVGPRQLGRYVVLQRIGTGASGEVYLGLDPELGRKVAIKCVTVDEKSARDAMTFVHERDQVLAEARALAALNHPGVVAIYDVGILDTDVFLAMECLEGVTLRAWLTDTRPTLSDRLQVLDSLAQALDFVHESGLIHRDIKPENVMLTPEGRVVLLDFGLAFHSTKADDKRAKIDSRISQITASQSKSGRSKWVDGTPAYMAPEQMCGADIDHRSDLFSFFSLAYEVLCGTRPFPDSDPQTRLRRIARGQLSRPRGMTRVPRRILRIVVWGLKYNPDDRPTGLALFREALAHHENQRSAKAPVLAALGLLVACIGFALIPSARPPRNNDRLPLEIEAVFDPDHLEGHQQRFAQMHARAHADVGNRLFELISLSGERLNEAWLTTTQGDSPIAASLIHRCISRRLDEFRALLELIDDGDANVARESLAAAQVLFRQSKCQDTRDAGPEVLPADERRRIRSARTYDQIAKTHVHSMAGNLAESRDRIGAICATADQLAFLPLAAVCEAERAYALRWSLAHHRAVHSSVRANLLALAARNDRLAASTSADQLYLVAYLGGDTTGINDLIAHAQAAIDRDHGNYAARAELARMYAMREFWRGGNIQLRARMQEALDMELRNENFDPIAQVERLNDLGYISFLVGEMDDGELLLRRAVERGRNNLGLAHFANILPHVNLAVFHEFFGFQDEALAELEIIDRDIAPNLDNPRGIIPCATHVAILTNYAWDDEIAGQLEHCVARIVATGEGDHASTTVLGSAALQIESRLGHPPLPTLAKVLPNREAFVGMEKRAIDQEIGFHVLRTYIAARDSLRAQAVIESVREIWHPIRVMRSQIELEMAQHAYAEALATLQLFEGLLTAQKRVGPSLLGAIALQRATAYWHLGRPEDAWQFADDAITWLRTDSRSTGQALALAVAVRGLAQANLLATDSARTSCRELRELSQGHWISSELSHYGEALSRAVGLATCLPTPKGGKD